MGAPLGKRLPIRILVDVAYKKITEYQRRPIANLSTPKNLVMSSAYARPPVHYLELGIKKLSRVGKGAQDINVAFQFGSKLTILGATNGVARVKI